MTYRDGQYEEIYFKEGEFSKRKTGTISHSSGTKVKWQPSEEFFTHTEVEIEKVRSLFKTISCLCAGLTIHLDYNGKEETFYSKNGIDDLVTDAVKDTELLRNRFKMNFSQGKEKLDFILTYTSKYSSTIVPYVNTGLTEKGPHITQIKTILTREFNKFFREKKWLKEKDENLTGDDIQEGAYIVFNLTAAGVSYDAQVKSTVTKVEMKSSLQALAENLNIWFQNNEKEIKVIADKALSARKAREAAKKAREATREKAKKKEKALKFDSKLADCYSKDRLKCEIYVTEGDSASGNLKSARDNEYQAIMPIRGKILNVRKASLDKIRKNAEIQTMIDAFGLSIDGTGMKLTYNPNELRYGKIIIESDADSDGSHIKNLFYTFIWTFCPQLIMDGYVYAGVPPLYKVTMGKDIYVYLKDDKELEKFKIEHQNKKYTVKHLKGLGEMDEIETEVLVNPDKRIIRQVTVEDIKAADILFDQLMGEAIQPRKAFIKEHSKEATCN